MSITIKADATQLPSVKPNNDATGSASGNANQARKDGEAQSWTGYSSFSSYEDHNINSGGNSLSSPGNRAISSSTGTPQGRKDNAPGNTQGNQNINLQPTQSAASGPPPGGSGPLRSVDQARPFMLNQGEGNFNRMDDPSNGTSLDKKLSQIKLPDGEMPDGPLNCGPTSTLMALQALHVIPRIAPANAEKEIEAMRVTEHPGTTGSVGSWGYHLIAGLQSRGGDGKLYVGDQVGRTNIDASLNRGNVVILAGDPRFAWANKIPQQNYLTDHNADFGHYVVVGGRAANGNYIVMDPLNSNGPMEVTPANLDVFIKGHNADTVDMVEASNKPLQIAT